LKKCFAKVDILAQVCYNTVTVNKVGAKIMLTDKDKAQLLRDAMELLMDADVLVQKALGATDACYDLHCGIEELVDELRCDVEDLERRAEGELL